MAFKIKWNCFILDLHWGWVIFDPEDEGRIQNVKTTGGFKELSHFIWGDCSHYALYLCSEGQGDSKTQGKGQNLKWDWAILPSSASRHVHCTHTWPMRQCQQISLWVILLTIIAWVLLLSGHLESMDLNIPLPLRCGYDARSHIVLMIITDNQMKPALLKTAECSL